MPENLYPQLPTVPPISHESFNIEMVRKYYQDIANLKEQYTGKQQKYKNTYNRLLHASMGASSVALVSGVSTIGMCYYCGISYKCFTSYCEHCFNVMHLASTLLTFPSCQAIFHQHQPMVSMHLSSFAMPIVAQVILIF